MLILVISLKTHCYVLPDENLRLYFQTYVLDLKSGRNDTKSRIVI